MAVHRIELDVYGEYSVFIYVEGGTVTQIDKNSYTIDGRTVLVSMPIESISEYEEHLKHGKELKDYVL